MLKRMILGASVAFGLAGLASGQPELRDEVVEVSIQTMFVPVGFDSNDDVTVVLDGFLPNGCYRVMDSVVNFEASTKTFSVKQMARKRPGICLQALVPFSTPVHLGVLDPGDYTILANNGGISRSLTVSLGKSDGIDDFIYAPVERAWVTRVPGGGYVAQLEGLFTNSCMVIKEVRQFRTQRTVQMLPIASVEGESCTDVQKPFSTTVKLPDLVPGRYLLHVRSLNGTSINVVFPVFDTGPQQ